MNRILLLVLMTASVAVEAEPAVVLYCSVDETFAKEIVARYEETTGRKVQLVGDTEAGKTTGLVKRLRLERDRPRADVFWSSEQSQTVRLARRAFAPYVSPSADDIPAEFKDPKQLWTGFAVRARVVAYDPARTKAADVPKTWAAYAEQPHASRVALANPLFGTTRGHLAAMKSLWGDEKYRAFLTGLDKGGAMLADGNAASVRKVISGEAAYAFTDSDDVVTAQTKGKSLAMVFPDMGDGGTMLIPNTVALVKGGPHLEQAKQLIDYILSPEVEARLARSDSANYPVRKNLQEELKMTFPPASRVPYEAVADEMPAAITICREIVLN